MALSATGISGLLDKNARGRSLGGLFGGWKSRTFVLTGQSLSYADPSKPDAILGTVNTKGCTVDPVVSGRSKKFVFIIKTQKNDVNKEAEEIEINAGNSKIRKLWADSIAASSTNAEWRTAPVSSSTDEYLAGNARAMGSSPDRATLIKIMTENPQWETILGWKALFESNKVMSIWPGVVLDPKGSGAVTKLMLNDLGLEGALPPSISQLLGLEMLLLTNNTGLTGNIPASWVSLLRLSKLWCRNTGLVKKSEVPQAIKDLPGLQGSSNALQMPNPAIDSKAIPKFEKEEVKVIKTSGGKIGTKVKPAPVKKKSSFF